MHIRSTIYIDPDVWRQLKAEARKRRVSASWLNEEVLREFLITEKLANEPQRRKTRAPKQLEAAVDLSA
jgi:predicted transcriptional regulator